MSKYLNGLKELEQLAWNREQGAWITYFNTCKADSPKVRVLLDRRIKRRKALARFINQLSQ